MEPSTNLETNTTTIGMTVIMVATWTTDAKSSAQWNKNWPNDIPKTDNIAIGRKLVFKGEMRSRDFGSNNERINNAKPPIPKRQTVTSIPETPESLTKNSELAWPHIPKNAAQYAKNIINLFFFKNKSNLFPLIIVLKNMSFL